MGIREEFRQFTSGRCCCSCSSGSLRVEKERVMRRQEFATVALATAMLLAAPTAWAQRPEGTPAGTAEPRGGGGGGGGGGVPRGGGDAGAPRPRPSVSSSSSSVPAPLHRDVRVAVPDFGARAPMTTGSASVDPISFAPQRRGGGGGGGGPTAAAVAATRCRGVVAARDPGAARGPSGSTSSSAGSEGLVWRSAVRFPCTADRATVSRRVAKLSRGTLPGVSRWRRRVLPPRLPLLRLRLSVLRLRLPLLRLSLLLWLWAGLLLRSLLLRDRARLWIWVWLRLSL